MSEKLTQTDLDLIRDEEACYERACRRVAHELHLKSSQLASDQRLARRLTRQIVATRQEEEKQALQSDESVAHGLAKLRLKQSRDLADLTKQPYFARVVYREKNRDVEFKLGLASFPELRIIDWRKAPLAKLYYDHEEGDEFDEEIAGVVRQGKILLKRAYSGEGRKLLSIDLKEISYVRENGKWQKQKRGKKITFNLKDREQIRHLLRSGDARDFKRAASASGYLHNVLSLLTPEQFRLISLSHDKPVLIQGGAGTGKTTVAMHRLAWLLFEGNSPVQLENILVMMFNRSLAAYVKHVLPELGIRQVRIATFYEWAEDIIRTTLARPVQFISEDIPSAVARFKASHHTLSALKNYLKSHGLKTDFLEELRDFYSSPDGVQLADREGMREYFDKQLQAHFFDIYDMAFLLQIIFSRKGCYQAKKYPVCLDYVVIDEAQDFTVAELGAVMNALSDKRRFVMAGDMGQRILDNRDFGSWQDLLGELSLTGVDVLNLNIAYRCTYQIYELAEFVRDPTLKHDDLQFVPHFGPDPTLNIVSSFQDAMTQAKMWIEEIMVKNRNPVGAVICRTHSEAQKVYESLVKTGFHGVRFGDSAHFEFTPGLTITAVHDVKGLEFSHVLIFNPGEKNYSSRSLHDRNLLYVAITRASYQVDMICYDLASRLIPNDVLGIKDLTALGGPDEETPVHSDIDQDLSQFEEDGDDDIFTEKGDK